MKSNKEKTYSKSEYKMMTEVLKEAEEYLSLSLGDQHFVAPKYFNICSAIVCVKLKQDFYKNNITDNIITAISKRLGDNLYYQTWVEKNCKIKYDSSDPKQYKKMQYSRLCWMRAMQAEFLEKSK